MKSSKDALSWRRATLMFLAFAAAYFISAALRSVIATLAPTLTQEFALQARDLGLLSGGYFLGFAALQIPLGQWLDRYGPKRIILLMLIWAALGCAVFACASDLSWLLLARVLCGLGVSVCLMAPLTAYRRWFKPEAQLRANSWMLMCGSLGMLCATLPVQIALPALGWRGIFWSLTVLILMAMVLIVWFVPASHKGLANQPAAADSSERPSISIWRHPAFVRMVPIGFVIYGGMIAMQTLWAGPWMTRIAGYTPEQAARGLFAINLAMLLNYWVWGLINPWLTGKGWDAVRLIRMGLPLSLLALPLVIGVAGDVALGSGWVLPIWGLWIFYFLSSAFVSLAQPAVALAFDHSMAGRALTAYNLVIFMGVFCVQWGIGLGIDAWRWLGLTEPQAYVATWLMYWVCCMAAYVHFYRRSAPTDNRLHGLKHTF